MTQEELELSRAIAALTPKDFEEIEASSANGSTFQRNFYVQVVAKALGIASSAVTDQQRMIAKNLLFARAYSVRGVTSGRLSLAQGEIAELLAAGHRQKTTTALMFGVQAGIFSAIHFEPELVVEIRKDAPPNVVAAFKRLMGTG